MKKKFSVSQKQGIIKPIEKKGKDKRQMKKMASKIVIEY